jgi:replicative DNA helicase
VAQVPNQPSSNRKKETSQDNDIAKLNMPPHSLEAEQAVLGSIIQSIDAWDKVAEILIQEDFYNRSHRVVFTAITRLISKNSAADPITLKAELELHDELDDVGGFSYLVSLARNTPSSSNITAYANIVRERAVVRELIGAANDIADISFNPQGRDSKELLDLAESKVFEIAEKRTAANEGPISVFTALQKTVSRIEELAKLKKAVTGVSTGYTDLDKKTSGLQPSDLIIVAARPSMGKCIVSGSTLVDPESGAVVSIDDMVTYKKGKVTSLSDQFTLTQASVSDFVDDGIKPVFELITALGRSITTTITHPFLTANGWQPLADISSGEYIAVPRVLPIFGKHKMTIADIMEYVDLVINDKDMSSIPQCIFTLEKSLLGQFIHQLFVSNSMLLMNQSKQAQFVFETQKASVAKQLQHLLLRFGIITKCASEDMNTDPQNKSADELELYKRYKVKILDPKSIRQFSNVIGDIGTESENKSLLVKLGNTLNDVEKLPNTVVTYIASLKGNTSWEALFDSKRYVRDQNDSKHFRALESHYLTRENAAFFAMVFNDNYLHCLANSDVYWDEIVSITAKGEQQVYDLTVPDVHNFIAQDICVHNTTFAMNLVENALLLEEKPVLVFSLEMPSDQIMMRMLASLSRVDQTSIRTARLNDDDWGKIQSSMVMLKERDNLFIDDSSGLTPMEVRTRARKLARDKGGLSMIMIDYLQLMRVPSLSENRTLEISEISRSLKALAKELKCPVVALSQLNRGLEQRADKRPINSDLRESGAIEQDADLIMFIYRDEVYNENSDIKGVAEIIIGKQRNGPIGTTRLTFQGQFSRFDNYTGPAYGED